MKSEIQSKMSRRSFLGLGALVAAGSAASMAGCAPKSREGGLAVGGGQSAATAVAADWLGAEPEITDIARTEDTGFLIIGAGTAGLAAAASAADLGLDFILCEKSGTVQETREYWGAVDTKYQKQMGVEIDKPKLLNEITRYASGKCNQEVIKVWLEESAEAMDWIDPLMAATEKPCIVDAHTDHATGGTDYYVPVLQHIWLTPYTPPMSNDFFAAHIE